MAERQVSVGNKTYPLPPLFMVMATQNPIEQEGTYPLPEAQLDRFLLHVNVDYPDIAAERKILAIIRAEASATAATPPPPISQDTILNARRDILSLHLTDAVEEYIVQLINATRRPGDYSETLAGQLEYGASPRGTIALERCARAHAWLAGKDYVSPDDVAAVIHDCLRHRLILSFEAEAAGTTANDVIDQLLASVPVA
jgi:MoxR-like ATPase